MSFEILHFRGADKILKDKKMEKEVKLTMEYLNDVLYGTFHKRELLRQALEEMDWRPQGRPEYPGWAEILLQGIPQTCGYGWESLHHTNIFRMHC